MDMTILVYVADQIEETRLKGGWSPSFSARFLGHDTQIQQSGLEYWPQNRNVANRGGVQICTTVLQYIRVMVSVSGNRHRYVHVMSPRRHNASHQNIISTLAHVLMQVGLDSLMARQMDQKEKSLDGTFPAVSYNLLFTINHYCCIVFIKYCARRILGFRCLSPRWK